MKKYRKKDELLGSWLNGGRLKKGSTVNRAAYNAVNEAEWMTPTQLINKYYKSQLQTAYKYSGGASSKARARLKTAIKKYK